MYLFALFFLVIGGIEMAWLTFSEIKGGFLASLNGLSGESETDVLARMEVLEKSIKFLGGGIFIVVGLLFLILYKLQAIRTSGDHSSNMNLMKLNSIYNKISRDEFK